MKLWEGRLLVIIGVLVNKVQVTLCKIHPKEPFTWKISYHYNYHSSINGCLHDPGEATHRSTSWSQCSPILLYSLTWCWCKISNQYKLCWFTSILRVVPDRHSHTSIYSSYQDHVNKYTVIEEHWACGSPNFREPIGIFSLAKYNATFWMILLNSFMYLIKILSLKSRLL